MYRIGRYVFPQLIWTHLHRHLHRVRASRWLVGYHDCNYPDVKAKIRSTRHAIILSVVYTLREWMRKRIYFLYIFLFFCMLCGNHSVFLVLSRLLLLSLKKPLEKDIFYIRILHINSQNVSNLHWISFSVNKQMLRHCSH